MDFSARGKRATRERETESWVSAKMCDLRTLCDLKTLLIIKEKGD